MSCDAGSQAKGAGREKLKVDLNGGREHATVRFEISRKLNIDFVGGDLQKKPIGLGEFTRKPRLLVAIRRNFADIWRFAKPPLAPMAAPRVSSIAICSVLKKRQQVAT